MLSTEAVFKDMSIGIVVIMIGTMIYIIRILYKKERKRKFDLEGSNYDITMLVVVEHPPKRTVAKYLEGIKEATQKILRPLKKIASSKDSPSSLEIERNPSPYIISSTKSFKTKSRTSELLNYDFNYNSRVVSLISPPPPLHLKSQDENIEINSMQTSLSDTQPSSLKIPAQVPSRAQRSLMTSPISSRSSSRSSSRISLEMTSSRDPLNPKMSKQESENSIQPIAKDETNDYTNFQPIQNIKPIQNSQLLDKGKTVVG